MKIRVLLVDDHTVVREGVRMLLEAEGGIQVVGEAGNGADAVTKARTLTPHVIVMDISMPEMNGIEAIREIRAASKHVAIVVLSMYATAEHVYRAFQSGASGYVLKECAGREVIHAVKTVHEGQSYVSSKISGTLIDDYVKHREDCQGPLDRLSAREREVLQLVVEGWSSARIAEAISLSRKTVETYRSRIMQKLEVKTLPDLIRFALQHGLTVE